MGPPGEGKGVAAVPTKAAAGVTPAVLRAPVHVALGAPSSDVEDVAPVATFPASKQQL